MLTIRWAWLAKLMKAEPVTLIRDGKPDRKVMLWHGIGDQDLLEGLRLEQAESPAGVKLAMLENSGRISVVKSPHP